MNKIMNEWKVEQIKRKKSGDIRRLCPRFIQANDSLTAIQDYYFLELKSGRNWDGRFVEAICKEKEISQIGKYTRTEDQLLIGLFDKLPE